MKVVILAGGYGTRLSEETKTRPKPMVEIGGKPILWHIMKHYAHYGFREFVLCLGYKGEVIKDYFLHYAVRHSDMTIDLQHPERIVTHHKHVEPWKITLADTGEGTMTGGRIKRIAPYVDGQPFMLTYGDGVSNVDLRQLLAYHRSHGKLATVTAVQPEGRFGALQLTDSSRVERFAEKAPGDGHWINSGFFVFEPGMFDYLAGDDTVLELQPLEQLAATGQLMAYQHSGFWHPMDTLRDRQTLEGLWQQGQAQWQSWQVRSDE